MKSKSLANGYRLQQLESMAESLPHKHINGDYVITLTARETEFCIMDATSTTRRNSIEYKERMKLLHYKDFVAVLLVLKCRRLLCC